jgi:hypothetical protein
VAGSLGLVGATPASAAYAANGEPVWIPRNAANTADLLVSGLLDQGSELAQHPAVIDAPYGEGHVVLFSNNPFWRAETKGSYFLVFNAILNFDSLNTGRKLADK